MICVSRLPSVTLCTVPTSLLWFHVWSVPSNPLWITPTLNGEEEPGQPGRDGGWRDGAPGQGPPGGGPRGLEQRGALPSVAHGGEPEQGAREAQVCSRLRVGPLLTWIVLARPCFHCLTLTPLVLPNCCQSLSRSLNERGLGLVAHEPAAGSRAIPGSGRPPGEGEGAHSSTLPWRTARTEESAGLQSMESQRAGHD